MDIYDLQTKADAFFTIVRDGEDEPTGQWFCIWTWIIGTVILFGLVIALVRKART